MVLTGTCSILPELKAIKGTPCSTLQHDAGRAFAWPVGKRLLQFRQISRKERNKRAQRFKLHDTQESSLVRPWLLEVQTLHPRLCFNLGTGRSILCLQANEMFLFVIRRRASRGVAVNTRGWHGWLAPGSAKLPLISANQCAATAKQANFTRAQRRSGTRALFLTFGFWILTFRQLNKYTLD